jgi:MOSC domain-containing protein YiiM
VQGTIVQVAISPGGLPKHAISGGLVTTHGLQGDHQAHPGIHGGPRKAVLLASSEMINELIALGYPLFPGALGENLTVRGIDFRALRVGDMLRAGGAILEITQPRGPCSALDVYGKKLQQDIFDARVKAGDSASPRWGLSGLYASVTRPGPVEAGDIIALMASLA